MSADPDVVQSLFLPLVRGGLLLPISVVAEVVTFERPARRPEMPRWLAGSVPWRGRALAVCYFEAALGEEPPICGPRSRIAVLHGLHCRERLPYFGIAIQSLPSMAMASRDIVVREPGPPPAFTAASISMGKRTGWIPDLERLEAALLAYTALVG